MPLHYLLGSPESSRYPSWTKACRPAAPAVAVTRGTICGHIGSELASPDAVPAPTSVAWAFNRQTEALNVRVAGGWKLAVRHAFGFLP